jgi:hypothetical protein
MSLLLASKADSCACQLQLLHVPGLLFAQHEYAITPCVDH